MVTTKHQSKATNLIPLKPPRKSRWTNTAWKPPASFWDDRHRPNTGWITPTVYWDEYLGNCGDLTPDKRHRPHSGMNRSKLMQWSKGATWHQVEWHQPHTEMPGTDFADWTKCAGLILEQLAPTSQTGWQPPTQFRDDRHWPDTWMTGTNLIPTRENTIENEH